MPNIGMGEVWVGLAVLGLFALGAVALLFLGRKKVLAARCPLCTAAVSRQAVVCPNCRRDLPAGWAD